MNFIFSGVNFDMWHSVLQVWLHKDINFVFHWCPNLLQLKLEEKLLSVSFLLMCIIHSDVHVSDEYSRIL